MAGRKTYHGCIDRPNDRPGESWRWRVQVSGRQHVETFPSSLTRAEVEKRARELYPEIKRRADRRAAGLPDVLPMSDVLDRYEDETLPTLAPNTRTSYAVSLRPIRAFFVEELGDPDIDQVRAGHVERYLAWRRGRNPEGQKRKTPLSNRTLEKERAILHRIFTLAERTELRDGNPVAAVERPKVTGRDPIILSGDQYEALLKACGKNAMLRLYTLVLGETGARCESEALQLRWENVDLAEGFLWIDSAYHGRRTKSGKGRHVPMTPRLHEAMREHFARFRMAQYDGRRSPWVFHLRRKVRGKPAGARIECFRRPFMRAARKAKLPEGFRQHDLRHRRVTTWIADGKSPALVQEAMGHADITTTMGYRHLAREHLRALVDDGRTDRERLAELR